ncbi:MAG: response regulator [Gloeomargarita sp. SKYG116]|nr:response regulator [Gloeomargarita sp. SKYG116]MCS7226180.1 response regulator [Gloeomargarita sp. SKYB31]MDW8400244.1 response regulator [Gloeomargarita sp. SKYGB_i_bin116]
MELGGEISDLQRPLAGHVTLYDPADPSVSWHVYLGPTGTRLHYAGSGVGRAERFHCLMQLFFPKLHDWTLPPGQDEYDFLYQQAHRGGTTLAEVRQILLRLTQEGLAHFLVLLHHKSQVKREDHSRLPLNPILLALNWMDVVKSVEREVRMWAGLRYRVPSPFARFHLPPHKVNQLYEFWSLCPRESYLAKLSPPQLQRCVELFSRDACGYELARELHASPAQVVQGVLPLVQAGILLVRPFQEPEPPKKLGPKVACVDDSPAILSSVTQILQRSGYEVIPIADPRQVIATLEQEKPALVLLDVLMPELNGYELCKLIRQHAELRHIPIVFLTGKDGLVDKVRAKLLGVREYLTKPVDAEQLRRCVQQVLAHV